eukprot:5674954-Heterocapsa_arctica.AAC.1
MSFLRMTGRLLLPHPFKGRLLPFFLFLGGGLHCGGALALIPSLCSPGSILNFPSLVACRSRGRDLR